VFDRLPASPAWVQVAVYTVLLLALDVLAAPGGSTPFIYFQF
jgi:hypothetical protein